MLLIKLRDGAKKFVLLNMCVCARSVICVSECVRFSEDSIN